MAHNAHAKVRARAGRDVRAAVVDPELVGGRNGGAEFEPGLTGSTEGHAAVIGEDALDLVGRDAPVEPCGGDWRGRRALGAHALKVGGGQNPGVSGPANETDAVSLAVHRHVAAALRSRPELVKLARENLRRRWAAAGGPADMGVAGGRAEWTGLLLDEPEFLVRRVEVSGTAELLRDFPLGSIDADTAGIPEDAQPSIDKLRRVFETHGHFITTRLREMEADACRENTAAAP